MLLDIDSWQHPIGYDPMGCPKINYINVNHFTSNLAYIFLITSKPPSSIFF